MIWQVGGIMQKMISSKDALQIIMKKIRTFPVVKVSTHDSLNYVLARDLYSPLNIPPFNKSAMDGYVMAKGDKGSEFKVVGEIAAGQVYKKRILKGTVVKVMTGAAIPVNAEKVIMKEHVKHIGQDRIVIIKKDSRNNICIKGEDLKKGSRLFSKGENITSLILANIAAAGIDKVNVYKKPDIGIMRTGSELLELGEKYKDGKIYNSNGPLLKSLLSAYGVGKITLKTVKDSIPVLKQVFAGLIKNNDVVFITGGVSVGDYDYVNCLLDEMGCKISFNKVSIQPGKPFTFATYKQKLIFAFPGNPVSVFTTYYFFALPALYKMSGVDFSFTTSTCVFRGTFKRRRCDRELYLPVKFSGNKEVGAVKYNGSGDLFALSRADGFMVVPIGKKNIKNGEKVKII
ncbi:MAG: hypothetical protein COS89_08575 [Deltaproteobacteria bacterium CG07_land_8_20_14_0_80_38_7]|nr:MAG: hypothetical protein COS89_08575 [Deltaproteobacteria bacterium CG07_land_8_20_14_0_80_38_7]